MLTPLLNRCAYKNSVALALIGAPGHGKTALIEEWCRVNKRPMVKLLASCLDETDVAGVMVPRGERAVTLSPNWVDDLGENGVLFTDELNCLPGDTEILTDKGFVRFDELEDDAVVAQVDEKQEITFVKPEKVHRIDYEGELIHITSHEVEMLMTPNHRVAYRTEKHGQLKIMTAEEAYKMAGEENGKEIVSTLFYIPSHGFVNGEPISSEPVIDYWIWSTDFSKEQYKGKVYCVTVPTGMFVARYKKSTFVTGNCARKEVQDTLLTIIQSRHMPNGEKLPEGMMIIAAMNPAEMCDNYEMSPAMRTRFMWCKHSYGINSFVAWLTGQNVNTISASKYQAPTDHQTFDEWLSLFRESSDFEADKKALLFEAVKLGLDFTPDLDFADKDNATCPRSLANLTYWTRNAAEMVQFAPAFVDEKEANILKSVPMTCYKNVGNSIFKNTRKQTEQSEAENELLEQRKGLFDTIQEEVNQAE